MTVPASANVQIAPMFLKNLHPQPWQRLLLVRTWGHAAQLASLKASTSILCLRFHLEGEAGLKHDRRQQRQKEEL